MTTRQGSESAPIPVITRFAPSPTGLLHIGGVRTALFSWLYARRHGGRFLLRIEDTDRERSTPEAVRVILDGMQWLGLDWDGAPVCQTARFPRYREIIDRLLAKGRAYRCACSRERLAALRAAALRQGLKPRYDGLCRARDVASEGAVVRFKTPPDGHVSVPDQVQGEVSFANRELDDLIIARADGSPTYNLTVVVDDMDMAVSHVIRGDDHLNNTPRQINIFRALGAPAPRYAHIPMILGEDGRKLSKREGAASVLQYRDAGFLPAALLNYLVRLGWARGDQEVFSVAEMIAAFDIAAVNKSAASINPDKLRWLNQHYLKNADDAVLAEALNTRFAQMAVAVDQGPPLTELVAVQKQRTETLKDMAEQSVCFYEDFAEYQAAAAKKHLRPVVLEPLIALKAELEHLPRWTNENIQAAIEAVAARFELKMPRLAQPLRVLITGAGVAPAIDDTLRLAGRARTLERMAKGIVFIQKRAVSAC